MSTWKDYTQPNFNKHKLNKALGMGRDPMLYSKQKPINPVSEWLHLIGPYIWFK